MVLARVAPEEAFSETPCQFNYLGVRSEVLNLPAHKIDIPREWLVEHYINQGLSPQQCAVLWGCSWKAIRNRLIDYNIPRRSQSEAQSGEKNHQWGMPHNEDSREKMRKAHQNKRLSDEHRRKIGDAFRGRAIAPRSKEHQRKLNEAHRGDRSSAWKGGISFEPYCPKFNNQVKEEVREKFGRKCFVCGEPENGRRLDVHHCDYDKSQGCGSKWVLIPLCVRCHAKTNYNRWFWFSKLGNYWAMDPSINFSLE